MMAHSDVLVTVYSTMVVETAVHDTPIVAAVIDIPGGWNKPSEVLPVVEKNRQLAHPQALPRCQGGTRRQQRDRALRCN